MTTTKPCILLVEDEENLHEALKLNLELEGYEITSAFDGTKTLQKIDEEVLTRFAICNSQWPICNCR